MVFQAARSRYAPHMNYYPPPPDPFQAAPVRAARSAMAIVSLAVLGFFVLVGVGVGVLVWKMSGGARETGQQFSAAARASRWDDAHALLSTSARAHTTKEELERVTSKTTFATAPSVTFHSISISGDEACLRTDSGRQTAYMTLVKEGEAWRVRGVGVATSDDCGPHVFEGP